VNTRDKNFMRASIQRQPVPAGQKLPRHTTTVENGVVLQATGTWRVARLRAEAPVHNRQGTAGHPVGEHERVIEAMQGRVDRAPTIMRVRRSAVEHPFGTIKAWMGATHFRIKTLGRSKRK
jgi:transposase